MMDITRKNSESSRLQNLESLFEQLNLIKPISMVNNPSLLDIKLNRTVEKVLGMGIPMLVLNHPSKYWFLYKILPYRFYNLSER